MSTLDTALARILEDRRPGVPALMTHVVLGYPSLDASIDIVVAMYEGGASLVELQIPFSDPIADGPTIMAANEAALRSGIRVADCFKAAERVSAKVPVPLLFMTYFNIVYRYGRGSGTESVKRFAEDARNAGVCGLIVPDIPPEEDEEGYWTTTASCDVTPIPIVSPVSDASRLRSIRAVARGGFVYCVSTTGTTGARSALPAGLAEYLDDVRKSLPLPLAVGFGLSSTEQVHAVGAVADIAIVGSAMIDRITRNEQNPAGAARTFTEELLGRPQTA